MEAEVSEALAAVAAAAWSLTGRHKLERHSYALLIVGHDCGVVGGRWRGGVVIEVARELMISKVR